MYVQVKDLPAPVQEALTAVSYGRKDITVQASTSVVLSSSSGDGMRAFVALVNLSTGKHTVTWGSWGGANMFNPTNAVDNDDRSYELPADGVAIRGTKGGNQPVYATLHVPASMVDRILPSAGVTLTEAEKDALYCHKAYKGGQYRRDELARRNVTAEVIDGLVERGLLSRNKAGAVQITTDGKNAIGDERRY